MKQVFSIKFYRFAVLACATGWGWLIFQLWARAQNTGITVCWVKRLTGLPCPGCGITRNITSLIHGDIAASLQQNLLGYPALLLLTALPVWIVADSLNARTSLYNIYKKTESKMQNSPIILTILLLAILANWSWNVWKGV